MTACGTVNLHTEHWCTVQRVEMGLKKKKTAWQAHALPTIRFYHTSLWSQL